MAMAVGSLISPWVSNSFGVGRSVILGNSITAFAYGTLAIAAFVQSAELSVLALVMSGFGTSFYIVNQTSIRQSVTPPALMARVHASRRFVVFSFLPLGSLTGGLVADEYSLAASLSIACLFMTIAALITLFSPLRHRSLQLTTETGAS
jgi:predicted MFS family arabinose efflux permease